jgi:hypothetical protein
MSADALRGGQDVAVVVAFPFDEDHFMQCWIGWLVVGVGFEEF